MAKTPIALFKSWYAQACRAGVPLRDAVALATADASGRPSVRFVLLKDADDRGFVFYTHASSRKGRELAMNPRAALAFYWHKTGRQVRVEGRITRVSSAEADAYWASRPRLSQLGALASHQSRPYPGKMTLVRAVANLGLKYRGRTIPRPAGWAGYRLVPRAIEFWTRGAFRLHERILYTRTGSGWKKVLLQP